VPAVKTAFRYSSADIQWDSAKDGSASQMVKNIATVGSIIRVIDAPVTFAHTVVDIYVIGSTAKVADFSVLFERRLFVC